MSNTSFLVISTLRFRGDSAETLLHLCYTPLMVTTLEEIKEKAIPILKEAGVTRAGVFGSFARGEQGPESDVDILVSYPEQVTLFKIAALRNALQASLGTSVDLVDHDSIKPRLRESVLSAYESIV